MFLVSTARSTSRLNKPSNFQMLYSLTYIVHVLFFNISQWVCLMNQVNKDLSVFLHSKEDQKASFCELQSSDDRLQPGFVGGKPDQKGTGASPWELLKTCHPFKTFTFLTSTPAYSFHCPATKLPKQNRHTSNDIHCSFIDIIN